MFRGFLGDVKHVILRSEMSLNIVKTQKDSVLLIRMSGSIEEAVHFERLLGELPAEVWVETKEISRINSLGVKAWIGYFQTVQKRGIKLRLKECSVAIVEQINLNPAFSCGGAIDSIYVPFQCTVCENEVSLLFETRNLKPGLSPRSESKCVQCGGNTVFDDLPDSYFAFLRRA